MSLSLFSINFEYFQRISLNSPAELLAEPPANIRGLLEELLGEEGVTWGPIECLTLRKLLHNSEGFEKRIVVTLIHEGRNITSQLWLSLTCGL